MNGADARTTQANHLPKPIRPKELIMASEKMGSGSQSMEDDEEKETGNAISSKYGQNLEMGEHSGEWEEIQEARKPFVLHTPPHETIYGGY